MAQPATTVVPFASLPSCATLCGPLYDANGACVPPAAPQADADTYDKCFCQNAKLQPFYQGSSGVCGTGVCDADPNGLSGIQSWFTQFCQGKQAGSQTTSAGGSSSTSGSKASQQGGGGSWISTHWQWVIFIVVVVLGIAGIWTGACIWRRKYLRKKDRMYELGKGLPSSVAVDSHGGLAGPGANHISGQPGMFMSSGAQGYSEKPKKERKKWNVTQRT
ncbi:hypothetical protein PG994_011182 [Apiospora phragmitis]|uniref:Integral membrane protein n=1 Tax=Apiospora phragmitis TaxID=2905665 RepID=A0ABR1TSA1_9PEZI